jgi:8-oxo-dGTP pyrophosphatase MutT (NUDIX family)
VAEIMFAGKRIDAAPIGHAGRKGPGMHGRNRQFGAIPFRKADDGGHEILLVTSRETKRWIVPKGWPMDGKVGHQVAAREAFEEAGIRGKASKKAVGHYDYWKRRDESFRLVRVAVFKLKVERLLDDWPEAGSRERRWFRAEDAVMAVDEPGLRAILAEFADETRRTKKTRRKHAAGTGSAGTAG